VTASKRLKPIKNLADKTEKNAAQDLGKSLSYQQDQINKLSQLIGYREEYLVKISHQSQTGVSGARLQQYHRFLNKLNSAITEQRETVKVSENHVVEKKGHWRQKNSRAQAIGKAVEKLKSKEKTQTSRKEMIQADELSTQAFIRNSKMAM